MKILHIGKFYSPFNGGIESFMSELVNQQIKDGHEVSAIVHNHNSARYASTEYISKVKLVRVPCYGKIAYAPISPSFGFHLRKILIQDKPDIIHIHMPNLSAFWCFLILASYQIPWVVHWHSDVLGAVPDYKVKLLYPFYRVFESLLLKRTKTIIATSPVYAESSQPLSRYIEKVKVVPLGLSDIVQIQKEPPDANERLALLMIGRLTYYKGHNNLIKALELLEQRQVDFSLRIVGAGELESKIRTWVESSGLTNYVELLGQISDEQLQTELLQADLLCLPSIERTEAFGVVLLEAMRASLACLVTNTPGSGMSWVVQNNETGLVVECNNVKALADRLNFVAENKAILSSYGMAGRERFVRLFSIDKVSELITSVYHSSRLK